MLSGVKVIPPEELLEHEEDDLSVDKQRMITRRKKERHLYNSSHEVEGIERDELYVGKKKKKRSGSCLDVDFDLFDRIIPNSYVYKRDKSSKSGNRSSQHQKYGRKQRDKVVRWNGDQNSIVNEKKGSDVDAECMIDRDNMILRKEMGLEWMLQAGNSLHGNPTPIKIEQEHQIKERKKMNPKELNPYLQDNGSGYPNDSLNSAAGSNHLLSSSLVGDGGASWRLKALKRAKEQAARDGLTLQEKHMDLLIENLNAQPKGIRQEVGGRTSRFIEKRLSAELKKYENDGMFYSERALPKQIMTQKERCQFCFENQSIPKHLIISIGNMTYIMLPPWEPILQGHCCILPLQHESATRALEKNVWEEIRNFKKCLLKMFSRQDKVVIFLETVIGLSKQQRHCLIECIPIPSHIAKQAPLHFKKAIDDAEDEWGQHDMKKVIPTNGNLRNVIPENFSYFHVEFGLDRGFVHVIDDDRNFPSSFGLNVVRGMLRLPVETSHHHQRRESAEKQKQAVATFAQEWELFDWTRELD